MPTLAPNGTERNGSVQTWVVPSDGIYRLEARGAKSGQGYYSSTISGMGVGAVVQGDFVLLAGQELKVVVGQRGSILPDNGPDGFSGGGGGTFVLKADGSPLVVAGGGGVQRAGYSGTNNAVLDASTGTSGKDGGGATGGINGNGGASSVGGTGGAGINTNGGAYSGHTVPLAYVNGSTGGIKDGHTQNKGGYGGGGSSGWGGASGGGGYSGGGGGANANNSTSNGGGGGSFISADAMEAATSDGAHVTTGSEPDTPYTGAISDLNDWNDGEGSAVITFLESLNEPPNIPSNPTIISRGPTPRFSSAATDPDGDQVKIVFEIWEVE